MKTRNSLRCLLALCFAATRSIASDAGMPQAAPPGNANLPIGSSQPAANGTLEQTASRQEQIRAEAGLLVTRLDEVIAEYTRNGLAKGDDFEALKQVRSELGSLSDEEMAQVVGLLKQAAADPELMAKAYSGQKDISVRLKQILAAHEHQQDIAALASAVRQLADRQSANLATAIDTRQLAAQDNSASGQAAVTASEQAQQSEEGAIDEEVKLVAGKLSQMDGNAKFKDAATQLDQVPPEASTASGALGGARLDDAMTAEKAARDQLEDAARALTPADKQEPAQNLDSGELAGLARDQRALLAKTTQLGAALSKVTGAETPDAMDKEMYNQIKVPTSALARRLAEDNITPASPADQIRTAPAMKAHMDAYAAALKKQEQAVESQLASLSGDQAALAAKAQMVRDDLQKTAKDAGAPMANAGAPMANALTQMNSAQEALAESDPDQATQEETDAANQLDEAQRLAGQSAASQAQAAPASPEQQLTHLQDSVNDLTTRETAAVQQGDALKTGPMAAAAADLQANLAGKAQALQQAAADAAPDVAPALQQAAGAFQTAAQDMQAGGAQTQAEAAQQSALQSLAQAGQQLAQQAAAVAQEKQALASIENQMAGLGKVIQQQRQLGLDTEKAVADGKAPVAKAKQLAREQANVRRNAENVRQEVNTGTPDAAKALDHADVAMGDSAQKLIDTDLEEAEPRQQAALAALYQAQDALADRQQKLAQDLGQPLAQEGAQALAALGKAEAQTATAQQDMGSQRPGAAAAQLNQAARQAAQAGAQPQALPQAARDAIRSAEQALGSAAVAAGAGQSQQAQAQAAQASQALSAAQSAIEGAQAGIAELSSPSDAQSQQASQQSNDPSNGMHGAAKGAKEKNWNDQAGAATAGAQVAHGAGAYLGLPDRDRAAIEQSQAEKYPQEYGSMIEEYMRSLAADAGGK